MTLVFIDVETYSELPIAKVGGYRYAEEAELLLVSYAIDDEPAKVVDLTAGEAWPQELLEQVNNEKAYFIAHNSMFDRNVLKRVFPALADPARWADSMVRAYIHSLPGALGTLCDLLGVPTDKAKDKAGRDLVRLFCCPQPKSRGGGRVLPAERPDEWAHFIEYNRLDTEAMREVWKRLPRWNSTKAIWSQWHLDQRINDRGMYIDIDLARAADTMANEARQMADERVEQATGGAVSTVGQTQALLQHICSAYGVTLPDLRADTVKRRIEDESLPPQVRQLLTERLDNAKTSVKKYSALVKATGEGQRLRGCLQFSGATRTMRWTGKLFQPQNLPRGCLKPAEITQAIADIKSGLLPFISDHTMDVLSSCVRSCIAAPAGRKLVVADLSNIEGRMLAWMASEEWKLEAFRKYDRGEGPDLYKATYARTFGIKPDEVTKHQRQIGKVMELGLGYAGGVGAFLAFASVYGLDLDDLAKHVKQALSAVAWDKSVDTYNWFKSRGISTNGLSQTTWVACNAIKEAWRESHPNIRALWADLGNACGTVASEGGSITVGRFTVDRNGSWLRILLPSGRYLSYPNARGVREGERAVFVYEGINQYTRRWEEIYTHGGKIVENCCQALARDVLAANMPLLFERGYFPVLSVHDEWITEADDNPAKTSDELASLMSTVPVWATGLPLAAAGFECKNYRKD